ncbi:ParA family protein (plasmid) [Lichenicola cladoniae]|uniref:ParA family protein n=1 Tax=Lichenicola cladoniae TaxID=1484109 RepID=A0A6M8HYG8_9PROT|nr:ParA family protein [Lichenicola cladoniae]NPD70169.1 ParA family protein [Acetobacteraceae bacterium]QKE93614.1 ParA family protein [Lichenicola cladoniae]
MKTLVILNEKGGVGKTTLSLHGAWFFAERYRTLVLDLDQQANLSFTLEANLSGVDAVSLFNEPTKVPRTGQFTVAGATPELFDAERAEESAIGTFRESMKINADDYDFCIIDTPPLLGLRTFAALLSADAVLAPIELGDYSITGVQRLLQAIKGVSQHYGRDEPNFLGLLASKFDRRSPRERALFEGLAEEIGGLLFPGVVGKRDVYARTASERIPVWQMKGPSARDAGEEIRGVFAKVEKMMELSHG